MSLAAPTPSHPLPALIDPIERRACAAQRSRVMVQAVSTAVVLGHVAWADANARISVLEAEIAALQDRRAEPRP